MDIKTTRKHKINIRIMKFINDDANLWKIFIKFKWYREALIREAKYVLDKNSSRGDK